ncbi:MAG: hypothetical protein GX375_07230, partial [Clostridiales bacterium]|nr:hypothetical protein [Clostridiales bacterium]
ETDWTFRPEAYYRDMVVFGYDLEKEDDETKGIRASYYDSEMITLDSDVLDYYARMTAYNQENTRNLTHYAIFSLGSGLNGSNEPKWTERDANPMDMSEEEAITMVEKALVNMGITDMQLTSCHASNIPHPSLMFSNPASLEEEINLAAAAAGEDSVDDKDAGEIEESIYSYSMLFTPTYQNVAVHDMTSFRYLYPVDKDQYMQIYRYEELKVTVKNGVIAELNWFAPMEQVRVENENVPVLSLEEAIDTFRKQMQLEYTIGKLSRYAPENPDYADHVSSIESGEVNITDIRLGLMRIRIKDRPSAYRMVPAWMFLGSEEIRYKGLEPSSGEFFNKPFPYAIVNAIDGSIIDPTQGY